MEAAAKNWYEKGSRTGPLQPMQYYLPSSHICHSPQEALVAIPNTHKSISKDYVFPTRRLHSRALVKHSEGAWETHNSCATVKTSESIGRSSTTFSSPQMLVPLPPSKTTKSLTQTYREPRKENSCAGSNWCL